MPFALTLAACSNDGVPAQGDGGDMADARVVLVFGDAKAANLAIRPKADADAGVGAVANRSDGGTEAAADGATGSDGSVDGVADFRTDGAPPNDIDQGTDVLIERRPDSSSACVNGSLQPCATFKYGICSEGSRRCVTGQWGLCNLVVLPGANEETCGNGLDDDCDGHIDADDEDCQDCTPGANRSCEASAGVGECRAGTESCVLAEGGGSYVWGPCVPGLVPGAQSEVKGEPSCADDKDNDCDGVADADDSDCGDCVGTQTEGCLSGELGVCSAGAKTCIRGGWAACVPDIAPGSQPEDCASESTDDDCDGALPAEDDDCDPCTNGTKDPDEGGIDCGGACPARCEIGSQCARDQDCLSDNCDAGTRTCTASAGCEPWKQDRRCSDAQQVLVWSNIERDACKRLCAQRRVACCAYSSALQRCSFNHGAVTFPANPSWIATRCRVPLSK